MSRKATIPVPTSPITTTWRHGVPEASIGTTSAAKQTNTSQIGVAGILERFTTALAPQMIVRASFQMYASAASPIDKVWVSIYAVTPTGPNPRGLPTKDANTALLHRETLYDGVAKTADWVCTATFTTGSFTPTAGKVYWRAIEWHNTLADWHSGVYSWGPDSNSNTATEGGYAYLYRSTLATPPSDFSDAGVTLLSPFGAGNGKRTVGNIHVTVNGVIGGYISGVTASEQGHMTYDLPVREGTDGTSGGGQTLLIHELAVGADGQSVTGTLDYAPTNLAGGTYSVAGNLILDLGATEAAKFGLVGSESSVLLSALGTYGKTDAFDFYTQFSGTGVTAETFVTDTTITDRNLRAIVTGTAYVRSNVTLAARPTILLLTCSASGAATATDLYVAAECACCFGDSNDGPTRLGVIPGLLTYPRPVIRGDDSGSRMIDVSPEDSGGASGPVRTLAGYHHLENTIFVVHHGNNDFGNVSITVDCSARGARAIAAMLGLLLRGSGNSAILIGLPCNDTPPTGLNLSEIKAYNAALRTLAGVLRVAFVDPFALTFANPNYMDGIHFDTPGAAAVGAWAAAEYEAGLAPSISTGTANGLRPMR